MTESTETENRRPENRRRPPADKPVNAAEDADQHRHEAGIDLPVVGHVPYKSVAFMTGLGVAGAAGVIEWPVAVAVGLGYALSRR